ncbi:YbaB/EbfC family nucleoid-associated protein [Streptomyces sp. NPDC048527]|uniref:YbaB/EbfC family nucleoid-associated protein n=1 Tax=Streptomyces sp. NPDC048527 TaxID=3365568 RepID=UPI00371A7B62
MPDEGRIDFGALAQRAKQLQGTVANVQEDIQAIEATGYGANGMIAATVSGEGRVVDLRIDSSVIDPDDPQTLCERIIAAIDSAQETVNERRTAVVSDMSNSLTGILDGLRVPEAGPSVVPRIPNRGARPRGTGGG